MGSRSQVSPVSGAHRKVISGSRRRRGRSLRLRAAERRASLFGARRLLRGSHPREGRRTFPRGKRGAHHTEVVSPCEGNERGNPFALEALARKRILGNQDGASFGETLRTSLECERARVGCSNGRARVSHQVCRSRRAAPDHHDAFRPRSERVDEGLAFHPPPISRAPKGRGDKDGGSGPGKNRGVWETGRGR